MSGCFRSAFFAEFSSDSFTSRCVSVPRLSPWHVLVPPSVTAVDLVWAGGFQYHLYAEDSHLCRSPKPQTHLSGGLGFTYMCHSHLELHMSRIES